MTEPEKKTGLSKFLSGAGLLSNTEKSVSKESVSAPSSNNSNHQKPVSSENKKPHNNKKSFSKPFHSKNSFNPILTDPNKGRLTSEKRWKFHPTNSLPSVNAGEIRVVPLGGLEQVGQNMMFLEWGDDIIVIDAGFVFPDEEHFGIDVLLPNIEYLVKNKKRIRGVVFTHGHLDHIGGVPHMIPELGFPQMFATKLTKELMLANTEDPKILKQYKITDINPRSRIKLGKFDIEFFHINHSIPDGVGIVVHTPYGAIVHTSDFKIDHNPSDENPADLGRIAEIGKRGVLLGMVDSTNATKKGATMSESIIEKELDIAIKRCTGRMIITTFASSIGRISKLVESAEKHGRTVFLSGRSMEKNLKIAAKLGYLKCKKNTIHPMGKKAETMPPNKVLILSTGSQGEPLAALTRMASGAHREIKLTSQDTILFSSSPIVGNEKAVTSVINNLTEIGVKIIDRNDIDVYVSGHAHRDEIKMMTTLLNPKHFAPIHGEIYMREANRLMAINELDYPEHQTVLMKNGQGVIIKPRSVELMTEKEAIPTGNVFLELGQKISQHTLSERTKMATGGMLLFWISHSGTEVKNISVRPRGFRVSNANDKFFEEIKKEAKAVFSRTFAPEKSKGSLEAVLKKSIEQWLYKKSRKDTFVEVVIQGS